MAEPLNVGGENDVLLEGEVASGSLEDAEHWLAVYRELSDFASRLTALEDAGERQLKVARRFRARLRYWESRAAALRRR